MMNTIPFTDPETGEEIELEIVDQTRINGVNYLLVADADDIAMIMKEISPEDAEEAEYDFVEDDKELDYIARVFAEQLEDVEIEL